jgi:hypothetical protein
MLLRRVLRGARPRMTLAISVMLAGLAAIRASQAASDAAPLETFLAAPSRDTASRLVDGVLKSGIKFDDVYRGLQRGRSYRPGQTGVVRLRNRTSDGVEHHYTLNVPDSYDPSRRYQVRFHLHGGVGGRENNAPVGAGTIGSLAGPSRSM